MKISAIAVFLCTFNANTRVQATSRGLQFDLEPASRQGNGNGNSNGNGNGNANGNGNGRGNGPPDHVPQHVLDKFHSKSQVKPGQDLFYQEVEGSMVDVGGTDISFDDKDLEPVNIMAKNARIVIDGRDTLFAPMVFQSKNDDSVTVAKNVDGKLLSASKRSKGNGRGHNLDVLPLHDATYVTVDEDDLDASLLGEYEFGESLVGPGRRRNLRSDSTKTATTDGPGIQTNQERFLSTLLDVVEIDVVADGYFCAEYGGNSASATAKVQTIVAAASGFYEVHGIQLKIKNIFMECSEGSGPIWDILSSVAAASGVCGSNGLVEKFRDYVAAEWQSNNMEHGDLVHLFHGYDQIRIDGPGNTIGCAYRGNSGFKVLCRTDGYNTGVAEITFSSVLSTQAKLAAHEIGHNLHAPHASEGIMYSSNYCPSSTPQSVCDSFDSGSVTTFLDTIANAPADCIEQISLIPTPAPTPAPTTAAPTPAPATPTPAPTPSPNCFDNQNFYLRINGGPGEPGCPWVANPTFSTTASICSAYGWIRAECPATCGDC